MKKATVRDIAFMAVCVVISLFAKQIVSPVTNLLTDMIGINGGSATVGFTLAFLMIGKIVAGLPWAATVMAFVQALLAMALGFAGRQGPLALITFTVPGMLIDAAALLLRRPDAVYCVTACVAGSIASALLTTWFTMHLTGIPLLLWLAMAALSGILGGVLARAVSGRIVKILHSHAGNGAEA